MSRRRAKTPEDSPEPSEEQPASVVSYPPREPVEWKEQRENYKQNQIQGDTRAKNDLPPSTFRPSAMSQVPPRLLAQRQIHDKSHVNIGSWVPPTHIPTPTGGLIRARSVSRIRRTSERASTGASATKPGPLSLNPTATEFVPMSSSATVPSYTITLQQLGHEHHRMSVKHRNELREAGYSGPRFDMRKPPAGGGPRFHVPTVTERPIVYPGVINEESLGHAQHGSDHRPVRSALDLSPPAGFQHRLIPFDQEQNRNLSEQEEGGDSGWVFYWNPPTSLVHNTPGRDYLKGIRALLTFEGIADFWEKVAQLQKPSSITPNQGYHNFMIFRKGLIPAWESFPHGGCWILTFKRSSVDGKDLDNLWQALMFMMVSDAFGTPEVVGGSCHIRHYTYKLTVWNRDNRASNFTRFNIADNLRMKLNLDSDVSLQYKNFDRALKDGSTCAHATKYEFVKVKF